MYKTRVTYKDLEEMANDVSSQIKRNKEEFSGILIVTRGGLVPGYMLAARLGIKRIRCIALESYSAEGEQGQIREVDVQIDHYFSPKEKWLIVDDLSDSGKTLQFVVDHYFQDNLYSTATFISKEGTAYQPEYYSYTVPKEQWIVFPYEVD